MLEMLDWYTNEASSQCVHHHGFIGSGGMIQAIREAKYSISNITISDAFL